MTRADKEFLDQLFSFPFLQENFDSLQKKFKDHLLSVGYDISAGSLHMGENFWPKLEKGACIQCLAKALN